MISFLLAAVLSQTPPEYQDNPTLDKPVSVRSDGEAVRVLVERVGEQAGVTLKAMPELGEMRVISIVKDAPAKEVMTRLAAHFEGTWRPAKDGYEFYQTQFQKQAQAKELEEYQLTLMR